MRLTIFNLILKIGFVGLAWLNVSLNFARTAGKQCEGNGMAGASPSGRYM